LHCLQGRISFQQITKQIVKIVAIKILTINHIKVIKLMLVGQLLANTEIIRLAVPVKRICIQINGKIAIF